MDKKNASNVVNSIKKKHNLLLIGWGFLAVYLLYFSWNWRYTMDVPPIRYAAQRILQGEILYKDIIEFNLPFTYLVHLIILSISEADIAVRIADLLFTAIGIGGVYFLTKNKRMTLSFAFLFFYMNVCFLHSTFMLQRELMLTCLLPYIIYPFWHAPVVRNWQVISSTVVLFCAMLIKPIIFLLLLGLWFILLFDKRLQSHKKLQISLVIFITLFAASITFLVLLYQMGLLRPFWDNFQLLQFVSDIRTTNNVPLKYLKLAIKWGNIILVIIATVFYWKKIKNEPQTFIIAVILLYTLFHAFVQGKGYTYHLHLFLSVLLVINAYYITTTSSNKAFNEFILFSYFLWLLYAVARVATTQPYPSNVQKAIHLLEKYSYKNIQSIDGGTDGIEIVERLHLKNKYPIFYNFVYDAPFPHIQSYKDSLVQDLKNGNIDVVIHSYDGIVQYPTKLGKIIAPFLEQNYDTLISLPPYTSKVYVSKKLQKKK